MNSSNSVRAATDEVLARTGGRLYALVNNGAYGQHGAVKDLTRDTLRRQFETNVFGTQKFTNLLIPVFRRQGWGRIVQIRSVLGSVCLAYCGAYNATKYALEALSDTMRLELRGTGISVSLIEPGPITGRFRENAYAALRGNIDAMYSAHRHTGTSCSKGHSPDRLGNHVCPAGRGGAAQGRKVVHALGARRPRVCYRVTLPTHFLPRSNACYPQARLTGFCSHRVEPGIVHDVFRHVVALPPPSRHRSPNDRYRNRQLVCAGSRHSW